METKSNVTGKRWLIASYYNPSEVMEWESPIINLTKEHIFYELPIAIKAASSILVFVKFNC